MDNEELEGIRSDVRALRTDLGLDSKKDDTAETKTIIDDISAKSCEKEAVISSAECDTKSREIDTKMVESHTKSGRMSTIDAYFTANIMNTNMNCSESNKKQRSPFPERETAHTHSNSSNNNISNSGIQTPKDETTADCTDKSVKKENNGSVSYDNFDDFEKFDYPSFGMEGLGLGLDLGLNLFTPSILLLVDEIAALERDLLDRQTDINNKVSKSVIFSGLTFPLSPNYRYLSQPINIQNI